MMVKVECDGAIKMGIDFPSERGSHINMWKQIIMLKVAVAIHTMMT